MAMNGTPISSHISIRRRYVRSVDMERDVGDPAGLDGYVVTPSIRDATTRILSGLSDQSSQRAFRVVGPYGAGKSAFGLLIAQLFAEQGKGGPATELLQDIMGDPVAIPAWRPIIINGRRASFARELLNVVVRICDDVPDKAGAGLRDANSHRFADEAHLLGS